jgi:hypothetical protein
MRDLYIIKRVGFSFTLNNFKNHTAVLAYNSQNTRYPVQREGDTMSYIRVWEVRIETETGVAQTV